MNISFGPRGMLMIDNARIVYRNFSGHGSKYNREGDRNFAVVITDEEIKEALVMEGWNVRIKPPREDGDTPFMYLPVKIKFNDRGPNAYLLTGRRKNKLDEESISVLDDVDILNVNIDIRPYDWEVNGKEGRTAYLQAIEVTQQIDRFAARHAEEDEGMPF